VSIQSGVVIPATGPLDHAFQALHGAEEQAPPVGRARSASFLAPYVALNLSLSEHILSMKLENQPVTNICQNSA